MSRSRIWNCCSRLTWRFSARLPCGAAEAKIDEHPEFQPNRELGRVERINKTGRMDVRFDSGRTASFEPRERRHPDYGYAVTSHSSQGQTADRVLVHVETERASEQLVNRRLAYVAVSRGRYDAQIYTDDKAKLIDRLERDVSHRSALERGQTPASSTPGISRPAGTSESREQAVAVARTW